MSSALSAPTYRAASIVNAAAFIDLPRMGRGRSGRAAQSPVTSVVPGVQSRASVKARWPCSSQSTWNADRLASGAHELDDRGPRPPELDSRSRLLDARLLASFGPGYRLRVAPISGHRHQVPQQPDLGSPSRSRSRLSGRGRFRLSSLNRSFFAHGILPSDLTRSRKELGGTQSRSFVVTNNSSVCHILRRLKSRGSH